MGTPVSIGHRQGSVHGTFRTVTINILHLCFMPEILDVLENTLLILNSPDTILEP